MILKAHIYCSEQPIVLEALIDSRSAGNFIDHNTAILHNIPLSKLNTTIRINTIDGGPIGDGEKSWCTQPIKFTVSSLHFETISLLVTNTPKMPIILGIPWLQQHNPLISWTCREITKVSDYCLENFIVRPALTVSSTSIESPKTSCNVEILKVVDSHLTAHMICRIYPLA